MSSATTVTTIVAFSIVFSVVIYASALQSEEYFHRCPRGHVLNDHLMGEFSSRSGLACVLKCSQMPGCEGANICPSELSGRVRCSLTEGLLHGTCDGLVAASSSLCYHIRKRTRKEIIKPEEETTHTTEETETTAVFCQNGGTPSGDKCNCPIRYGGRTCHRYIRDCTEAAENGYTLENDNGPYYILPVSSPDPFVVICDFRYGGVTHPFRRTGSSSFNLDWNACKAGFGDDLWANPDSYNFFVGLERLHFILEQGNYELYLYMQYSSTSGGMRYDNFNVGPESTSYAVSFDKFYIYETVVENGFSTSPPLKFSATGNDVNGCFLQRQMAGWYGADCSGYSIFSNGSFQYPVNGNDTTIDTLQFNLFRRSPLE